MAAKYDSTDAEMRQRLCNLIRLVQCSQTYLSLVVPALALAHHDHRDSQAGWFPIEPAQANWFTLYANASGAMKEALWKHRPQSGGVPDAWLSQQPRRQCLPKDGRVYKLSCSRDELAAVFGGLEREQRGWVGMRVKGTPIMERSLHAMGVPWRVLISHIQGKGTAGLYVKPMMPSVAFGEGIAHLEKLMAGKPALMPQMCVTLQRVNGLRRQIFSIDNKLGSFGRTRGHSSMLVLAPEPAEAQALQGQQGQRARGEAAVEAQWVGYLADGNIHGTITLLPSSAQGAAA